MDLYLYTEADSFLHRLDGLTKIALLCGNCTLALFSNRLRPLTAVLVLILLQMAAARSLGNLRRIWRFLALVTVLTALLWTAVGRGPTPLFAWMTREGLLAGLAATLRIDSFILAGMLFLSTTRNEEMLQGLLRLRVPYPVCFAFSMALRLAPAFVGMGWAVREAQKARGLNPDAGSLLARLRKNVPLLVPALLSTIRMTGQLAMSLESRGFGLNPHRTFLAESHLGWRDAAAAVGLAAALLGGWLAR